MNDQEQHLARHGRSQFIFGILVGILVGVIFTTKKGRYLLKTISDEGFGKFSQWEDIISALEGKINDELSPIQESEIPEENKEEVFQANKFKDQARTYPEMIDKSPIKTDILEKIEEKAKEVEAIATELREVKEAMEETVDEGQKLTKVEDSGDDLPLHKAVEGKIDSTGEKQDLKKRRFFKGVRKR